MICFELSLSLSLVSFLSHTRNVRNGRSEWDVYVMDCIEMNLSINIVANYMSILNIVQAMDNGRL